MLSVKHYKEKRKHFLGYRIPTRSASFDFVLYSDLGVSISAVETCLQPAWLPIPPRCGWEGQRAFPCDGENRGEEGNRE